MSIDFPNYRCYPPAPNWYSSFASTVVDSFFLYASRNLIVVLHTDNLQYVNSFAASKEKIEAIAAYENLCFTAGSDKAVRVWDYKIGVLLSTHTQHQAEITALNVIRDGNVYISGDTAGRVVVSDTYKKVHIPQQSPVASKITSMASTNVNGKDFVAIGYENGMIFIEEIHPDLSMTNAFQIVQDTDPIQSVEWQKLSTRATENTVLWPLLAFSTKRRKQMCIWEVTSMMQLCTVRLPRPSAQLTDAQRSSVNIQIAWPQEHQNTIYFSSYLGQILSVDVSNPSRPHVSAKGNMNNHSRQVFAINHFAQGSQLITISLDTQIIKWDTRNKQALQIIKTQSKYPYAMDTLPWDRGQLAIALGDKEIKFWKFSHAESIMQPKKAANYYSASVLWKGLQGKIEKIRAHPLRENIVAFSNEFGHVSIYDMGTGSASKFKWHHHKQGASCIDWGRDMSNILEREDMRDTLLSCGSDGMIHVYDAKSLGTEPVVLNSVLQAINPIWFERLLAKGSRRYSMKVDSKGAFLAFGHTNGLVEVYDMATLKIIYTSDQHRQLVTSLDWKYYKNQVFLASSCSLGEIVVHELSQIDLINIPDVPVSHQGEYPVSFKANKECVNDIKWSPHNDKAFLASASDDNTVVVWDVEKRKMHSRFSEHRSKVLSVEWNQSDDNNEIFSGGQDKFIYHWNYLNFNETANGKKARYDREMAMLFPEQQKKKRKAVDSNSSAPQQVSSNVNNADSAAKFSLKKKPKLSVAPTPQNVFAITQASESSTGQLEKEQYCFLLADKIWDGKVREAARTLQSTYISDSHLQDAAVAQYLSVLTQEIEQKSKSTYQLIHGDANDVRHLIELEVNELDGRRRGTSQPTLPVENDIKEGYDMKLALDIMRSQSSTLSEKDPSKSFMSDWIEIALSPMMGKQKWIELVLKQAEKMETMQQYHLAASCYIACSHIYDAIALYKKHGMLREAIVLAKLRLPSADPIVKTLFADWAKELEKGDQHTLTAACYLLSDTMGATGNAIDCLARENTESSLFYTACLAVAADDSTKEQRVTQWSTMLNSRYVK